jgi:hypothetical protein
MNQIAFVHPSIRTEVGLLDRSVEIAEAAFTAIQTGAADARACQVYLGSARVLQGAARQRLNNRLAAGKLALQEAKLIEQEKDTRPAGKRE